MPLLRVTLIKGYDESARIRLAEKLTDAVRAVIDAPADLVTVTIDEAGPGNYMRGRQTRMPGPALPDASTLVLDYLAAMQARELDRARGMLADNFSMTLPGGHNFTTLESLTQWAATRYTKIEKTIERHEECILPDGVAVYVYGTLNGVWLNGETFSGVRFIDRFTVCSGLLQDQLVWNDLDAVISAKNS